MPTQVSRGRWLVEMEREGVEKRKEAAGSEGGNSNKPRAQTTIFTSILFIPTIMMDWMTTT